MTWKTRVKVLSCPAMLLVCDALPEWNPATANTFVEPTPESTGVDAFEFDIVPLCRTVSPGGDCRPGLVTLSRSV